MADWYLADKDGNVILCKDICTEDNCRCIRALRQWEALKKEAREKEKEDDIDRERLRLDDPRGNH
jgi:phosphoribosylaminoimidazole-succinocarboxamide synthase